MGELLRDKSGRPLPEVKVTTHNIANKKRKMHCEEINTNFLRSKIGEGLRVSSRALCVRTPIERVLGVAPRKARLARNQHGPHRLNKLRDSLQTLYYRSTPTTNLPEAPPSFSPPTPSQFPTTISQHLRIIESDIAQYTTRLTELNDWQNRVVTSLMNWLGASEEIQLAAMFKEHGIGSELFRKGQDPTEEYNMVAFNKRLISRIVSEIAIKRAI